MDILRFFTAGNVDDGKSTLIGRLLFDSKSISTDIIETITRQSKNKGKDTDLDLALLTDGLRAEREQGITIDVAYKYFSTEKRKFIIADTPGHIQYTRNMFTGASTADVAIILIDIVNGITEQTRRHSIIASILGLPNVLICINKMDLVSYSENFYSDIIEKYKNFAGGLNLQNVDYIPVSALEGENIIKISQKMPWFSGQPLLTYLETIKTDEKIINENPSFQIQYVNNLVDDKTKKITRRFLGKIQSGIYSVGTKVKVWPEGIESEILNIEKYGKPQQEAIAGDVVSIQLTDELDISRGVTIIPSSYSPNISQEFEAKICWMDNAPFRSGQRLLIQHHAFTTKAKISEILHKIDIQTNQIHTTDNDEISLNEICTVKIKTSIPLVFESYFHNREAGSFILVDENTNNTVAAGIILNQNSES